MGTYPNEIRLMGLVLNAELKPARYKQKKVRLSANCLMSLKMARSRNIKPGFFQNENLAEISAHGRLLFIGLWTLADKDGLLEYRTKRINALLFPYESIRIEKLLEELGIRGFIKFYGVDNKKYIQITNWGRHQNPHKNEKESELPKPELINKNNDLDKNLEITGNSREITGAARVITPDSLNLIPDSLNPINPMSGKKPDGALKNNYFKQAEEVIEFLNQKTGKNFCSRNPKGGQTENTKMIIHRLKQGYTVQQMKTVIARKCREWQKKEEMIEFLRPATLFNTKKFESYLGECTE